MFQVSRRKASIAYSACTAAALLHIMKSACLIRCISDNLAVVEASSKKGRKNKMRFPKSDKKAIRPNDVRQGGKCVLPRDD